MSDFSGKVAVIVGASNAQSIGPALARELTGRGAKVVVASRRLDACKAIADDIGCEAAEVDQTSGESSAALAARVLETHGRVDIAVNATGTNSPAIIAELTEENVRPLTELQWVGGLWFLRDWAEAMVKCGSGGAIVMYSSLTVPNPNFALSVYSGTKAAADQAVRVAAKEYGQHGIRINSLSPGLVKSAMTEGFFSLPKAIDAFRNETALGRIGDPGEVARATLPFLSDDCITTGAFIDISYGGQLYRLPKADEMGVEEAIRSD